MSDLPGNESRHDYWSDFAALRAEELRKLELLAAIGLAYLAFREAESAETDNRRATTHLDGAEWEGPMMRFAEATAVAYEKLSKAIAAWEEAGDADES